MTVVNYASPGGLYSGSTGNALSSQVPYGHAVEAMQAPDVIRFKGGGPQDPVYFQPYIRSEGFSGAATPKAAGASPAQVANANPHRKLNLNLKKLDLNKTVREVVKAKPRTLEEKRGVGAKYLRAGQNAALFMVFVLSSLFVTLGLAGSRAEDLRESKPEKPQPHDRLPGRVGF